MGVIRCPEHGLSFIQRFCEHIADALDADKLEHTNLVIDGADNAVMLCDECCPQALKEAGSSTEEWKDVKVVIECGEHATTWFSRTGQGDLLELLESIARLKSSTR